MVKNDGVTPNNGQAESPIKIASEGDFQNEMRNRHNNH
jgi:hypothetical protein